MANVSLGQHMQRLQGQKHKRRRVEFLLGSFGVLLVVILIAMFIGISQQRPDGDVTTRLEQFKERLVEREAVKPARPKPIPTDVKDHSRG